MSERLEKIFSECKSEVTRLHYRWTMYRQVYATNAHRVEILNRTAANFLAEVQALHIDGMLLDLSKLTDPARQGRFENISLELLINELEEGEHGSVEELRSKLTELREASEKFRSLRNKKIAHADLYSNSTFSDKPLPGVSSDEIEQGLALVRDIMNSVESRMYQSLTFYDEVVTPLASDGRSLVIWLQKGLAYEELSDSGEVSREYWRGIGKVDS